jgi:hypothetical protein
MKEILHKVIIPEGLFLLGKGQALVGRNQSQSPRKSTAGMRFYTYCKFALFALPLLLNLNL